VKGQLELSRYLSTLVQSWKR